MPILFLIGVLLLVLKLIKIAVKLAWGISKFIFCVIGFPIILISLFFAGLVYFAVPVLVITLIAVILIPMLKK